MRVGSGNVAAVLLNLRKGILWDLHGNRMSVLECMWGSGQAQGQSGWNGDSCPAHRLPPPPPPAFWPSAWLHLSK
jgi:hypothetical protein